MGFGWQLVPPGGYGRGGAIFLGAAGLRGNTIPGERQRGWLVRLARGWHIQRVSERDTDQSE